MNHWLTAEFVDAFSTPWPVCIGKTFLLDLGRVDLYDPVIFQTKGVALSCEIQQTAGPRVRTMAPWSSCFLVFLSTVGLCDIGHPCPYPEQSLAGSQRDLFGGQAVASGRRGRPVTAGTASSVSGCWLTCAQGTSCQHLGYPSLPSPAPSPTAPCLLVVVPHCLSLSGGVQGP